MMRFVSEIADHETGLSRQVFRDPKLELFIWWDRNATHSRKDVIRGFELHYAINTPDEWSIRWTEKEGTSFHRVDTHGADPSDVNNTPPAMVPVGRRMLPIHDLHAEFVVRSRYLDEVIRSVVLIRLSHAIRRVGA